jgi:hypothetical protein
MFTLTPYQRKMEAAYRTAHGIPDRAPTAAYDAAPLLGNTVDLAAVMRAYDAAARSRDADPDDAQREKNKERADVLRAKLHEALGGDADP